MSFVTVEDQYKKFPDIRREDVQSLLEWVLKQPHLPKLTELEAFFFLKCYKGSIESAKGLVENFYTVRTHIPEIYQNRDPKLLLKDMDVVLYNHLKTKQMYVQFIDTDPAKYNMTEQIRILGMVFDLWLMQEGTVDKYEAIIDMKGAQVGHLGRINLTLLRKALHILQEAVPIHIKYIHIINVLPFIDKFLAMIKPFIKANLLNILILHKDGIESLYKFVPQSSLPKHLGGDDISVEEAHEKMKSNLLANREYFLTEQETKRVCEEKRVGRPKNSGDLFGIEGSFKKLDLD